MSSNIVNVKIQEAYDTEANWSTNNPVLLEGQIAISSDKNGMYKVGDGTSTWSALSYNTANTANSAAKWDDAISLTLDGSVTGSASIDGSGNVTLTTTTNHTHTKSQITDFPTSLKNPNALTVQFNGTTNATYDGSVAKTVNITPSAIGAAASSHGNHVPAKETANNARYLRNDNTWATITADKIGAAASSHSHAYLPLSGGTLSGGLGVSGSIECTDVVVAQNRLEAVRIKSNGTYSNTTSGAANVAITSGHYLVRSTASSKRYKHDINPITGYKAILDIPVKEYIYNLDYLSEEDQRYNTVIPGFIAEDVYEHYPIAAEIVDGEVDDWNIRMIVPPMLKLIQDNYNTIQEQNELIQNLIKRVEELEAK